MAFVVGVNGWPRLQECWLRQRIFPQSHPFTPGGGLGAFTQLSSAVEGCSTVSFWAGWDILICSGAFLRVFKYHYLVSQPCADMPCQDQVRTRVTFDQPAISCHRPPNSMAPADVNALYLQLRKRLIESGEWEQ